MSNASDKSRWTALIGAATAAVALSTSIVSCQQKQAELVQKNLELDQKKAEFEAFKKQKEEEAAERVAAARKNWFDSVVKSGDLVSQVRVLRFLIATETDSKLLEWGKRELEILERELARAEASAKEAVATLRKEVQKPETRDPSKKIELALRTSDLARIERAGSAASAAKVDPVSFLPAKNGLSQPECISLCAPPARHCEGSCNKDQACLKGCFAKEAECRKGCQAKL
jgi:hypothetical protein